MVDALRSGRSALKGVGVRLSPSAPCPKGVEFEHALVAQRIERFPAEEEVVSSNLAKRAIYLIVGLLPIRSWPRWMSP